MRAVVSWQTRAPAQATPDQPPSHGDERLVVSITGLDHLTAGAGHGGADRHVQFIVFELSWRGASAQDFNAPLVVAWLGGFEQVSLGPDLGLSARLGTSVLSVPDREPAPGESAARAAYLAYDATLDLRLAEGLGLGVRARSQAELVVGDRRLVGHRAGVTLSWQHRRLSLVGSGELTRSTWIAVDGRRTGWGALASGAASFRLHRRAELFVDGELASQAQAPLDLRADRNRPWAATATGGLRARWSGAW
jgi:hypothetical protein